MSLWMSAETLRLLPAVSVIRDVTRRLTDELHAVMGGLPDGLGGVAPTVPDERPPLVIRKGGKR